VQRGAEGCRGVQPELEAHQRVQHGKGVWQGKGVRSDQVAYHAAHLEVEARLREGVHVHKAHVQPRGLRRALRRQRGDARTRRAATAHRAAAAAVVRRGVEGGAERGVQPQAVGVRGEQGEGVEGGRAHLQDGRRGRRGEGTAGRGSEDGSEGRQEGSRGCG
jgi:hypothetical protein